jgi:flavodoxin
MDMNSIVIYASRYGNTKRIAEAIARGLQSCGPAQVFSVDEAPATLPLGTELVVVGGPTEVHRMTQPVARFFDRMAPGALRGVAAVAFDTRLRSARWLSGSAALGITHKLRQAGTRVIASAESFFVEGAASTAGKEGPELEPGELERAAAWAVSLLASLAETGADEGDVERVTPAR